jgi:hypothetical protein
VSALGERLRHRVAGYGGQQPLRGYAATLATYAATVAGLVGAAVAAGRRPPDRPEAGDVVLLTVATHKLARIIAKDAVTSPLRAPTNRFVGAAGASEVNEQVRHPGQAHAAGELLSCPFCLAVWIATGLSAGLVFAPRLTRLVAAGLTAVAGADFLQLAYDAAKKASGNAG